MAGERHHRSNLHLTAVIAHAAGSTAAHECRAGRAELKPSNPLELDEQSSRTILLSGYAAFVLLNFPRDESWSLHPAPATSLAADIHCRQGLTFHAESALTMAFLVEDDTPARWELVGRFVDYACNLIGTDPAAALYDITLERPELVAASDDSPAPPTLRSV